MSKIVFFLNTKPNNKSKTFYVTKQKTWDTLIPTQFSTLPPSCLGYTAYDVSKQNGGSGKNCVGNKVYMKYLTHFLKL